MEYVRKKLAEGLKKCGSLALKLQMKKRFGVPYCWDHEEIGEVLLLENGAFVEHSFQGWVFATPGDKERWSLGRINAQGDPAVFIRGIPEEEVGEELAVLQMYREHGWPRKGRRDKGRSRGGVGRSKTQSEWRREKRCEALDRLVKDRVCPVCGLVKLRSRQWVIRDELALCRSCDRLMA